MKRLFRYFNWDLQNEYRACGYFCVMAFCYGAVEVIYGKQSLNILVLVEMFLLNYVISVMQKLVLDEEKDYDLTTYKRKTLWLTVVSTIIIIVCCHGFGWFKGRSIWAEVFLYLMMIVAYLTVRVIEGVAKHYDTQELNQQLEEYKRKGR